VQSLDEEQLPSEFQDSLLYFDEVSFSTAARSQVRTVLTIYCVLDVD